MITDPAVSAPALRVFCLLASYADREGWCWPSLRTLGAQLGMARSTVCDHISHLATLGHVTKAERTLPGGTIVTAYMPRLDATRAEARRSFRAAASRSAHPNGRSEITPPPVRLTRTMEVEPSKKTAAHADTPVEPASAVRAGGGSGARSLRQLLLDFGAGDLIPTAARDDAGEPRRAQPAPAGGDTATASPRPRGS